MNVLIVDTSVWIDYFGDAKRYKGLFGDIDLALAEGRVHLPPIVIAELLSGKLSGKIRSQLLSFLAELPLCVASYSHWVRVGELRATLTAKGHSISTPDAHIAQCALDLKGYIVSGDTIFAKVANYIDLKLLPSS